MTMKKLSESNNTSGQKRPYRPVVIIHGLMTGDISTMQHLAARITELHPGTKTYVIDRFCGLASLEPLWHQTKKLADDLLKICSLHPEGVHVIGYSQGGLIARGMIEEYGTEHNVRTFVSLSSPQGGQYGAECFTKMFPTLTTRAAYELFYTRFGQEAVSVANFWYDPRHRELYLKYSVYLAVIDNVKQQESSGLNLQQTEYDNDFKMMMVNKSAAVTSSTTTSTTKAETNDDTPKIIEERVAATIATVSAAIVKIAESHDDNNSDVNNITADVDTLIAEVSENGNNHSNSHTKKLGLLRLQRLVLIGGPDDGVISPWQSSQFGVLNSSDELIPMRERKQDDVYSDNDPIGLIQLDLTGRLIEYTVPGISHHEWHHNEKVLRECIIGWLD